MSGPRYRISSPAVVHDTIDDEVVIINFDTGSYYSLEKSSAEVWNMVSSNATLGEIVDRIARLRETDGAEATQAVTALLSELEGEGLITRDGSGEPAGLPLENPMAAPPETLGEFRLHKFTDMNHLLLLDPIHEVAEAGWPNTRADPDRTGNAR